MQYYFVIVFRRPKHLIEKDNYQELADIKLPKRNRVANSSNVVWWVKTHICYCLKILECNKDKEKYNEWRSGNDIIDLEEHDGFRSSEEVFGREQLSFIANLLEMAP